MSKDNQVVALVILSCSCQKSHAVKGLLLLVISLHVSPFDKLGFLLCNFLMAPIMTSDM